MNETPNSDELENTEFNSLTEDVASLAVAGESGRRSLTSPDPMMVQRDRRQATIAETDEQIRDAERRKASLEKPPGKDPVDIYNRPGSTDLKCDESYMKWQPTSGMKL